jgi:glycosyltransferase involved in cell wall biosynthesis
MKIAVVTCYRDADYIRARVLRAAFAKIDGVEVVTIKNSKSGVAKYLEVLWAVLVSRFTTKPDAYVLTFRGYETLPFIRLLTLGKPLIFDELINAVEWFVYEHKKLKGFPAKVLAAGYSMWAKTCQVILADTETHADVSSSISRIDRRKYAVIPVGTDESVFHYTPMDVPARDKPFRVFFYGYMLPLHGPEVVLQAAELLKGNPDIQFLIAGRTGIYIDKIKEYQGRGAHVEYREWIPFDELPMLIAESGLCIAGPFGNTFQAQHVINGKVYQFLASGSVALLGANKNTDLFKNRENCLIVPQGDAQAIATEIQWAYDNRDKLPAIAEAGRNLYDAHFTNTIIAGKLREMLEGLGLKPAASSQPQPPAGPTA